MKRFSRRWPLFVILISAFTALGLVPLATVASASGTWTATISGTSGVTTTGIVVSGSITPDDEAGFAQVVYEPSGGPALSASSPNAGLVIFNSPETTPQPVTFTVDQLSPETTYNFEIEAIEDDDDAMFFSAPGTFTTPAAPTGSGTPVDPPNDPSSNGIFGQCSSDPGCVNDMNGVRAAQENHSPVSLPSNWSTLTGAEQIFVWTDLERTSRGEVAIPNLVNSYADAVQTGITNDDDPSLDNLPGNSGSIWAGAYATPLGAMYGWLYDDGPGGENEDCTSPTAPGCWGHRDNILANASTIGNPTEMDAEAGTDSGDDPDYAAIFVVNGNATSPGNVVYTWAEEQPFLAGSTTAAPTISGVTLTGTPAAPILTVTGSNFGSAAPASSLVTCNAGDTGNNIFAGSELFFQDLTEGWGAGQAGDCIGLSVTSWSNTSVVFTFGNEYGSDGTIATGDQIEVTVQAATDTVAASFSTGGVPTVTTLSPNFGTTAGGTSVTITGTNFTGATKVVFGANAAAGFTVVSSTTITAVTPAEPAGLHNTEVTTASGTSAPVTGDFYTFVAPPSVTTVSPNSGTAAGGTTVTITGANFTGATKVVFGAVAAASFTVVSSTTITAVTPAEPAGLHNTEVTTSNGTSGPVTGDLYTFVAAPSVSTVSPNSGTAAGGTTVSITGTGFTGATKVVFGAVAATSFTVVSSTKITAVTPAEAAGLHNTEVTTASGTSAAVQGDFFTFH